jgi:hypothetical protein
VDAARALACVVQPAPRAVAAIAPLNRLPLRVAAAAAVTSVLAAAVTSVLAVAQERAAPVAQERAAPVALAVPHPRRRGRSSLFTKESPYRSSKTR